MARRLRKSKGIVGPFEPLGNIPSIVAQCCLPQRRLPVECREIERRHGRAQMKLIAGQIPHGVDWKQVPLPWGATARLLLAHLVWSARSNESPVIHLQGTRRSFMEVVGIPLGGIAARNLTVQLECLAAMTLLMSFNDRESTNWTGGLVAWRYENWNQSAGSRKWATTIKLTKNFYDSLQEHCVPVDMTHLLRLARSPRAMDIYVWLSSRVLTASCAGDAISLKDLHQVFGVDIPSSSGPLFVQKLKQALTKVCKVHPPFRVRIASQRLIVCRSRPPIDPI